jgi:N-acyl-D-amino-acid deacylase
MPQPHPDFLEEAQVLATRGIIDEARKEGIDVTYDIIAWDSSIAGATRIADEFADPRQPWVARFGKDQLTGTRFVENLKNPGFRAELRKVYDAGRLKLGMIHTKVDPYWCDHFRILKCTLRECEGKTVGEVALVRDKDPLDTVFDILVADPETIWVQFVDPRMLPTAISTFLKDPNSMPSTDTSIYPAQPGPNAGPTLAYGLYPNYIRTNVNRKRLLTLEEAVRKATSYPAGRFGLKDRGVIRQGAYADLVLFDLQTIGYSGDFLNPAVRPSGIECVIVNGEVVYERGSHTGRKPGKVLRRKDQS